MVGTVGPHNIREARRRLGQQLAALRKAAGHTQHSLAPLTLYGRSTIANTETGHQRPDRTFWQRCDEVLHTDGILTAGYDRIVILEREYQRARSSALVALPPPLTADHAPAPTISGGALAQTTESPAQWRHELLKTTVGETAEAANSSQGVGPRERANLPAAAGRQPSQVHSVTALEPHDHDDREPAEPIPVRSIVILHEPPTAAALEDAVARDARSAARFTRLVTASAVEPIAIDQISADIRRLVRSFISRPLTELFDEIRDLRLNVADAILRNKYPKQLRDLHLAGSQLSGLSAHLCLDLGDYTAADTHARAGWLCAELAGHTGMQAWVRALQSLIAYWDDRLDEAVAAAEDGTRYTGEGTVRVRLFSLLARAEARRHRVPNALAALDAANKARNTLAPEDHLGGLFTFPEAKQAAYAGTTLLTLNQPALLPRATDESQRALALYHASAPPDRSVGDVLAARLDLTTAHIAADDLDGAELELAPVLATSPSQRTASLIRRGLGIATGLAHPRFATSPQATRVRESLTNFTAMNATTTSHGAGA
ncbi:helix-turn-helix domain-containing protein [Micromonospora sp. NPDC049460]|uniref:helix-turn-helix domain-containing protein n=1 Tax=Micromonospora sp. NPDC049460 TaxID=3364272 RepID=UPI00378A1120